MAEPKARMVMIYKTPPDPAAFDAYYFGKHMEVGRKIPGLRKSEVSKGRVRTPGGNNDVHMVVTLFFDDIASMKRAFESPEGKASAADQRVFAPDPSLVQTFIYEAETHERG